MSGVGGLLGLVVRVCHPFNGAGSPIAGAALPAPAQHRHWSPAAGGTDLDSLDRGATLCAGVHEARLGRLPADHGETVRTTRSGGPEEKGVRIRPAIRGQYSGGGDSVRADSPPHLTWPFERPKGEPHGEDDPRGAAEATSVVSDAERGGTASVGRPRRLDVHRNRSHHRDHHHRFADPEMTGR